jgi:SAM-dependent methyltransferase
MMRLLILLVRILIALVNRLAAGIAQLHMILSGALPALLSPKELTRMIGVYYTDDYWNSAADYFTEQSQWTLVPWEDEVLAKHMTNAETVLVLGAGYGRESIALAQRGHRVVGLDLNRNVLLIGSRRAAADRVPASFVQADFLAPPILPSRFDWIFVSGLMYSSNPGRQRRQAWVKSLRSTLKKGGKIVLNFYISRDLETSAHRLSQTLNRWLLWLPGSNQAYQVGDSCTQGHFLHTFIDEQEIRSELIEAGAVIIELNWNNGFAAISFTER